MTRKLQPLAALLAMTLGASAGYKWPAGVDAYIQPNADGTTFVSGALSAVRNTGDTTAYFSCTSQTYATGVRSGYCNVRNAAGTYRACYTSDPLLLEELRSVKGDSYVSFRAETNGDCGFVSVQNASHYGAKQ